jgi:hypothetical protein
LTIGNETRIIAPLVQRQNFSRYVAANAAHFIVFALCARDEFFSTPRGSDAAGVTMTDAVAFIMPPQAAQLRLERTA